DNGGTYRDESWSSFRVGKTTPVGKYPYANGYGLYDMHGNVMEWCADWYDRKFGSANAADDAIDPTGRDTGSYRVIRGGDWEDSGGYCRTACRVYETPDYADYRVGFRVVVVP
ncbi:formylglycine-generating enzyme family protein, partial [Parabacteroides johnsonii]|uniref:formylglycine-generating enzyme family protein n=1 Tax=Parabacteroides johnsonii TaxID=387661 RepID=UPI00242CEBF7